MHRIVGKKTRITTVTLRGEVDANIQTNPFGETVLTNLPSFKSDPSTGGGICSPVYLTGWFSSKTGNDNFDAWLAILAKLEEKNPSQ